MRFPKPVLMTARDKNIAMAINQMVPLEKPDNMPTSPLAGDNGVKPVKPLMTSATNVAAPMGMALAIIATIVATNRASIPHALAERPSGIGISQIAIPTITESSNPCHLKPIFTSIGAIVFPSI